MGRSEFECHLTGVSFQGLLQHLLCFVIFLQLQEQLGQLEAQEVLPTDLLGSLIVIDGLSTNRKHRPQFGSAWGWLMPLPFTTERPALPPFPTGLRSQEEQAGLQCPLAKLTTGH